MTQLIKNIADKTHFTLYDSGVWHRKVEEFAKAIAESSAEQILDLRGYSGVGTDGNPYDTESWNAALAAAQRLIRTRFEIKAEITNE